MVAQGPPDPGDREGSDKVPCIIGSISPHHVASAEDTSRGHPSPTFRTVSVGIDRYTCPRRSAVDVRVDTLPGSYLLSQTEAIS